MKPEILTFEEAFKEQIENPVILTESSMEDLLEKRCYISGEPYCPGDQILMVVIPEAARDNKVFCHLAYVKKDVLQQTGWKFYARHGGIPTATKESVLKVSGEVD